MRIATFAVLAALCAGPAALAQTPAPKPSADPAAERRACVALAARSPAEALARADAWAKRGGGADARLCRAMADYHRGAFRPAAEELERLATVMGVDDPSLRAGLLARAGWARMRGRDLEIADRLYGAAIEIQPLDVDLWIDRALVRTASERYWEALGDLDRAIALDPGRAEVWRYRAQAKAALSLWDAASSDVEGALRLDPADPDARLLRGNLSLRLGQAGRAATDWAEVVRLAPGTPAARAATENLSRLQAAPATR